MSDTEYRIYLEQIDALKGIRLLRNQSMDVIITSPPYNMKKGYDEYADDIPREEYLRWMGHFSKEIARVLKPHGSFFLNFSGRPKDRWIAHELILHFNQFHLQNEIHWVKSITVEDVTYGQFQPINSPRYLNSQHEYLWHFTHSGEVSLDRNAIGVQYKDVTNLRRWKLAHKHKSHCRGDVWFIPYETRQRAADHPAMFPLAIPELCIKLHGLPPADLRSDMIVLDPFCGLGTTGVAAAQLGYKFLGFDVSAYYLAKSANRIYHATGEKTLLKIAGGPTDVIDGSD